jgi:thiamine biosynthesis lipoprotein
MKRTRTLIALGLALAAACLLIFLPSCTGKKYYFNEGLVFGTYYNIRYEATQDMESAITAELARMDSSLSVFNKQSIISRINRNDDVLTDSLFEIMFKTAMKVTKMSDGAFDITCGPLVNVWGFGPEGIGYTPTQHEIDSILQFVGFQYVELDEESHRVAKMDTRIQMDASAIAKGYGCDIIANLLRNAGCENYLVDIGGEVVAKGHSDKGTKWRLAITKPIDDPTGEIQEIEDIIETDDICIASSGNYRRFYYDGGERRSHTVDPRNGYPVNHNVLSATVIASSGIMADALATACMVMGEEKALEMIEATDDAACHLILAEGDGTRVVVSSRWMYE